MATFGSVEQRICLSELRAKPHLVTSILDEHMESKKKLKHLSERKMGPWLKLFLWGLRLYAIFMIVVVLINVFQPVH